MPHRTATSDEVRELRHGLEANQFVLAYQPKVDMRRGRVVGAEALVRWQHPQRGMLQPAAFIPLIEDHAVVQQLDGWALREALRQAAEWAAHGMPLPVSVNMSPCTMLQPGFAGQLAAALKQHGQGATPLLELEILENTRIDDLVQMASVIGQCEALGVATALDDFGTGHASLTWLRQLPVKALKLDRSFVRGILHDDADRAIVQAILFMAQRLGRLVVAEGVESVAHGDALMSLGCTVGQGFCIARAMAPGQMTGWVAGFELAPPWGRAEDLPTIDES
jgi:EAL domain-containing protein (putative c-di-GMP-specific phosphodiesterase class I)